MKEIGGYLELDSFKGKEYYPNYLKFNLSRRCLDFLVQEKKIKKIYLPHFLCDSVNPNCEIERYHINKDFLPVFDKKIGEDEYIYIVNFYGQMTNDILIQLREKYKNIIVDNVQAFFQKAVDGIDTIYSCRKFFGVSDGAYLATDINNEELEIDKSFDRMDHVLGRYENLGSDFYNSYKDNENKLNLCGILRMSKLTSNILKALDYEYIIEKRNQNFNLLLKELKNINLLNIKQIDGAYAYPLLIENGNKLRKKLIENKIFIPVLWPNVLEQSEGSLEYYYTNNILPIPCDQRYNEEDIVEMISIIKEEIKCIN